MFWRLSVILSYHIISYLFTFLFSLCSYYVTGMIPGAFFWGFFSDTLGRQKLLIAGNFLLAAVVVSSSFSQAFWILTFFKFLGGFMYVSCNSFNTQGLLQFRFTVRCCTETQCLIMLLLRISGHSQKQLMVKNILTLFNNK